MAKPSRQLSQLALVDSTLDADLQHTTKRIELVRTIQRKWAPAIIAAGVLNDDDPWTDSLARFAAADPRVASVERSLDEYFKGADTDPLIADPLPDDASHESHVSDVAASRAFGWGDAGFLLGLAVGMLLGPHAFEGGVR